MVGQVMGVAGLWVCGITRLQMLSWEGTAWHRRAWDGIGWDVMVLSRWWAWFLEAALVHSPR